MPVSCDSKISQRNITKAKRREAEAPLRDFLRRAKCPVEE